MGRGLSEELLLLTQVYGGQYFVGSM